MNIILSVIFALGINISSFAATLLAQREIKEDTFLDSQIEENTLKFQKYDEEYQKVFDAKPKFELILQKKNIYDITKECSACTLDDITTIIRSQGLNGELYYCVRYIIDLLKELSLLGCLDALLHIENLFISILNQATYVLVNKRPYDYWDNFLNIIKTTNTPNLNLFMLSSYPNVKERFGRYFIDTNQQESSLFLTKSPELKNNNNFWFFCNSIVDSNKPLIENLEKSTQKGVKQLSFNDLIEIYKKNTKIKQIPVFPTRFREKYKKQIMATTCFDATKKIIPIRGIENAGNTCYANSSLQALFAALRGTNIAISKEEDITSDNEMQKSKIIKGLKGFEKIFTITWEASRKTEPTDLASYFLDFIEAVSEKNQKKEEVINLIELLRGNQACGKQHDASEFFLSVLIFLIDSKLVFKNFFCKTTITPITCNICGDTNLCKEPFYIFVFKVGAVSKEEISLEELFEEEFKTTSQDNIDCDQCRAQVPKIQRKTVIEEPEILIFSIDRSIFRIPTNTQEKNLKKVRYGKKFLLKWHKKDQKTDDYNPMLTDYELVSVINHHGSTPDRGHYTADVLGPDDNWYNTSDSQVSRIEKKDSTISSDVYILLYRKAKKESRPGLPSEKLSFKK